MSLIFNQFFTFTAIKHLEQDFSTGALGPLGTTKLFSGGHEQRLLLISSAVILQNPSVTILIMRQLKRGEGARNHETLRTTGLEGPLQQSSEPWKYRPPVCWCGLLLQVSMKQI